MKVTYILFVAVLILFLSQIPKTNARRHRAQVGGEKEPRDGERYSEGRRRGANDEEKNDDKDDECLEGGWTMAEKSKRGGGWVSGNDGNEQGGEWGEEMEEGGRKWTGVFRGMDDGADYTRFNERIWKLINEPGKRDEEED